MPRSRIAKGTALGIAAVALIGGFEGLRTVAYRDPVGIPTVCFGETRNVHMGDKYSKEQCQQMLNGRLLEFEAGIRACLKNPDQVPDGAYVASLSLAYNIGVAAYCRSSVRKLLDEGKLNQACDAFMNFTKAGGITLPGLYNRRREERDYCKRYIPW